MNAQERGSNRLSLGERKRRAACGNAKGAGRHGEVIALAMAGAKDALTLLGIETSCDETAAAVVRGYPGAPGTILSNIVFSQIDEHAPFGGVVPEIAARAHIEHLDGIIDRAMKEAGISYDALDGIAATAGPGLIGGVMVGLMAGKAIALAAGKPFIAVNHLEGHALSARLVAPVPFPYLLLLVSGGHCQLLAVEEVGRYRRYGTTIDDAAGEAFDKTAKLLGLGYPGGPALEAIAKRGDPARFAFPRPMLGRAECHFSFSGLKTAVARAVSAIDPLTDEFRADIAASFQAAVRDVLCDRAARAMRRFAMEHGPAHFVVAGGVAANQALRAALEESAIAQGFTPCFPPPALCTDNGAMIAWAGIERLARGLTNALDTVPRARWPLDPDAPPAGFAGVKG
jgi:N6-L-threonylcarbamoyladenine synthase